MSTWNEVEEAIEQLALHHPRRAGESAPATGTYEALFESVLHDFVERGYSRERAVQVVEELVVKALARRREGPLRS